MKSRGDWIQTYSGIKFYPLDPMPEDILIEDIAHALSNICRFNGHTKQFYSVAQHSYLVSSQINDPKIALAGLLHDASEAYICDIPRPLKNTEDFERYREIEGQLQSKIWNKFGISFIERFDPMIHEWDMKIWEQESIDLMSPPHPDYPKVTGIGFEIIPMSSEDAKLFFLNKFTRLNSIISRKQ